MAPESGNIKPARHRSNVVFPVPLGPVTRRASPLFKLNDTLSNNANPPRLADKSVTLSDALNKPRPDMQEKLLRLFSARRYHYHLEIAASLPYAI